MAQLGQYSKMARDEWEYLQKDSILPLLHPLVNQIQSLFQVLPVNGILDLLVPTLEHGIFGSHGGDNELSLTKVLYRGDLHTTVCCATKHTAYECRKLVYTEGG